jgi:hypothetical protein
MGRSILAIVAGALFAIILTTLVDLLLHFTGVYPSGRLSDGLAVLATSYRIIIGIGGAWLTARLAPSNPMKHVMILATLGAVVALVGVVATWNSGLGPHWYPIALVVLAYPQSWLGAKLYESYSAQQQQPQQA